MTGPEIMRRLIPPQKPDGDPRRYQCGNCGETMEGAKRATNHSIFTGHVIAKREE